jgi:MerR family transcriptional regulator, light-induced transcriptional regulator
VYQIKVAAYRAGVTPEVLRAWERRYGIPSPERDASGYRLYSEEDIRAVRWIREQTEAGVGARQAAELFKGHYGSLEGLVDLEVSRDTLLDLLLAGKQRETEALLEGASVVHGAELTWVEVVGPVLRRIGEMWHRGEISIAHEHRATEIAKSMLVRSLARQREGSQEGARVVVACAPEERHEIGALILALFLSRRGFDVEYLGQTLPLKDLETLVPESAAEAVFLSVSQEKQARQMLAELPELEATIGTRVFLGGAAFSIKSLRSAAGERYLDSDLREAANIAAKLLHPGT